MFTRTAARPCVLEGPSALQLALFTPDDLPKPQIITQPETITAVMGKDVRFTCSAASSSSSPMTFAWKKDNEALANADMENFAHVRAQDGEVMEYTTVLHLRRVTFAHEGRYQCVITNHFGSSYSHKAKLTVHGTCAIFVLGVRFLQSPARDCSVTCLEMIEMGDVIPSHTVASLRLRSSRL